MHLWYPYFGAFSGFKDPAIASGTRQNPQGSNFVKFWGRLGSRVAVLAFQGPGFYELWIWIWFDPIYPKPFIHFSDFSCSSLPVCTQREPWREILKRKRERFKRFDHSFCPSFHHHSPPPTTTTTTTSNLPQKPCLPLESRQKSFKNSVKFADSSADLPYSSIFQQAEASRVIACEIKAFSLPVAVLSARASGFLVCCLGFFSRFTKLVRIFTNSASFNCFSSSKMSFNCHRDIFLSSRLWFGTCNCCHSSACGF